MEFEGSVTGYVSVFEMSPILEPKVNQLTATTSSLIKHHFKEKKYVIQCWNNSNELVYPTSIRKIDVGEIENPTDEDNPYEPEEDRLSQPAVRVTFAEEFTGTVDIMKAISLTINFENKSDVEIRHSINEHVGNIISQCEYNSSAGSVNDGIVFIPDLETRIDTEISHISDNRLDVSFGDSPVTGTVNAIIHGFNI